MIINTDNNYTDDQITHKIVFWLLGTAWVIVSGIIGYMVRAYHVQNEKDKEDMRDDIKQNKDLLEEKLSGIVKDFQSGVNSLKDAVSEMKSFLAVVKTEVDNRNNETRRILDSHEHWLEEHDTRCGHLSERVTKVETKIENHNK